MLRLAKYAQPGSLICSGGILQWMEDREDQNAYKPVKGFDQPEAFPDLSDAYQNRVDLTWRERLGLMWRLDQYGQVSPELELVMSTTMTVGLVTGVVGGVFKSMESYKEYRLRNQHEMFRSPFEAQRQMQDTVTFTQMRWFVRYSLKFGLMTFVFTAVALSLTAIRNKVNPLDHAVAGGVVGAGCVFLEGPKAMLGMGVCGAIVGLIAGVGLYVVHWLSGESIEERWNRRYQERVKEQAQALSASNSSIEFFISGARPPTANEKSNVDNNDASGDLVDEEPDLTYVQRTIKKVKLFFNM